MAPEVLAALEDAKAHGFLGESAIGSHVAHSLGFATAAEAVLGGAPATFLDLGSGGGVPGLVLADRWPSSAVVLLDAHRRRAEALMRAVGRLGWAARVEILWMRAEEAGRLGRLRGSQPLVVARSFGPPAVTAECAAPFLRPGGLLIVSEPPADGSEGRARWPGGPLDQLGLAPLVPRVDRPGDFCYQVLRQERPCPDRFPRRTGIPAKRPLYT